MNQSLREMLKEASNKYQNKTLYTTEERNITYNDLLNIVTNLSKSLINMGLKNKNIAIISENRYEWEIAFLSILSSNSVVIPIDKGLPKSEIDNILDRVEVEAIFCSQKYEQLVKELKNENSYIKHVISFDSKDETSFENLISQKFNFEYEEELDDEKTACIFFTSGTTSNSKAVMLSRKNIYSNIKNVSKILDINYNDVALSVLPLNHVLEGLFCFLSTINLGLERHFCSELDEIINCIKKYKITFMGGVPVVYEYLYKHKEGLIQIAPQINTFMCGGAKLNSKIVEEYKELGINLVQGYGLTETAPVISMENKEFHKLDSVGKPIPNVNVEIRNKDENGIGEIWVKGDNVFKGYYKNEEETNEVIWDGWFNTGDLGKFDDEGFLFICGRSKNVIVLENGKKVFPEELESLLTEIRGVKEALVFERKIGTRSKIIAKVVHKRKYFSGKTHEEIRDILLEDIQKLNENLPTYKKISDIIVTDKLFEKTINGKIKRNIEISETSYTVIKKEIGNSNFDKIKNICEAQLGVTNINEESNLRIDLGADSLDIVEILLKIEKEFNIIIPKEIKKQILNVKDVLKALEK